MSFFGCNSTELLERSVELWGSAPGWKRSAVAALLVATSVGLLRKMLSPKWRKATGDDFVLVTGASTGIGRTTALYLADEVGFTVFAAVRKESDADSLRREVRHKERLVPLLLDVTLPADVARAVALVQARVGDRGLLALFNNAGIGIGGGPLELTPLDLYRRVFETNFFGVVAVTQAFLPLLRKAKGVIVQNSSLMGFFATPFSSQYAASKFALEGLSDSLRRELKLHGVRVVIIEPGFIATEIGGKGRALFQQHEDMFSHPDYPEFLPYRRQLMANESASGHSPLLVAKLVDEAIRSPKPSLRYTVGGNARLVSILRWLPDSITDSLLVQRIRPFWEANAKR
eukprot:TRINITY_DN26770_c0_g1_i1.p1 TRINITY_DN26770_c0_g1~~TRINITY_DN26770_c0_g1_i1.p1  ORF type:complete len:344 (+),score=127.06 TRINITY_DN26770_c0_g1_i1:163-1194(+)